MVTKRLMKEITAYNCADFDISINQQSKKKIRR